MIASCAVVGGFALAAENGASLIFPHVAAGGGFSTTFTILNTGPTELRGRLILTDQGGMPLQVTVEGTPGPAVSAVEVEPATGGAAFLAVVRPAAGDTKSGWARLESSGGAPVGVATFEYFESGELKSQAGVLACPPLEFCTIRLDSDVLQGRFLGLAVANPGVDDIHVSVWTLGENGIRAYELQPPELNPLGPAKQMARFLHELLSGR
jgi:hypothetical protein